MCISYLKGIGTKEVTLVEILCSHNNNDIKEIKQEYKKGTLFCLMKTTFFPF
jgi:hypothetical protein